MWLYRDSTLKELTLVPVGDKANARKLKLQIYEAPFIRVKLVIRARSLAVSGLRSKTKGLWFKSGF